MAKKIKKIGSNAAVFLFSQRKIAQISMKSEQISSFVTLIYTSVTRLHCGTVHSYFSKANNLI